MLAVKSVSTRHLKNYTGGRPNEQPDQLVVTPSPPSSMHHLNIKEDKHKQGEPGKPDGIELRD